MTGSVILRILATVFFVIGAIVAAGGALLWPVATWALLALAAWCLSSVIVP